MKTIDNYINEKLVLYHHVDEKLTLNNQSKLQTYFEINIDDHTDFTKGEIDTIVDFFKTLKVKPYKITSTFNQYRQSSKNIIFLHYKDIHSDDNEDTRDSVISIAKKENNFTISISEHIDKNDHKAYQLYPYDGSYVSLNEITQKWFPKMAKHTDFLNNEN